MQSENMTSTMKWKTSLISDQICSWIQTALWYPHSEVMGMNVTHGATDICLYWVYFWLFWRTDKAKHNLKSRLIFGIKTAKIQKPETFFFSSLCIWQHSHSSVWCGFSSGLHAELGTLTKCHCGIFSELPNIKGEVVVAGGVLEEEDLPVVSFRPERGLGQVVSPFNVPKLFICACGSKTGHTVHWPRTLYWQTCDIVSAAVAGRFMWFHPAYICSWRTLSTA